MANPLSGHGKDRPFNEPYCSNCDYSLVGLTESSKCPECGKPIVEVLQRGPAQIPGTRKTSRTTLFGMPLYQVAFGPAANQKRGHAKAIVALGDIATGWLAIGGFARGIIAFGGLAIGLLSFGGLGIGLFAFGGWAVGGLAAGGAAGGALAHGGGAIGIVAQGGGAIGYYAAGGGVVGVHAVGGNVQDPQALQFFRRYNRVMGLGWSLGGRVPLLHPVAVMGWIAILLLVIGLPLLLIVVVAYARQKRSRARMAG